MEVTAILAVIFVFAVGIAVGCDVTIRQFKEVLNRSSKPFIIGIVAQFGFMPFYVFLLSLILKEPLEEDAKHSYEATVLGLTIVGCLPGGTTSNLFTYFVGGNLPLSIMMSFVSNVAALGLMPLMLFLYFETRFEGGTSVTIPYLNIILPMAITLMGVVIGMTTKAKASANTTWWVSKSTGIFALCFLFLALLVGLIQHSTILAESGWAFYFCCLTIQPAGYAAGMFFAKLCKIGLRDQMTISFETGVQSFATGIALAQLSFDANDPAEEKIFIDVFKFSAICGAFYAIHALWLVLLLRKIYPNGHRLLPVDYPSEEWEEKEYSRPAITSATCSPGGLLEPVGASSGFSSLEKTPPMTFPQIFRQAVSKHPKKLALAIERPVPTKTEDGKAPSLNDEDWTKWTFTEFLDDVEKAACALLTLGVEQFGSVAVFGFNSPEWIISCNAAIFVGAKVAGIYPTDTVDQICYKTVHSGAAVAVVEDEGKLKRYKEKIDELPGLKAIVVWGCPSPGELKRKDGSTVPVYTWEDFLKLDDCKENKKDQLAQREAKMQPGHCCALIYTSGTTGNPKAVMVSHDNIVFTASAVLHITRDIVGTFAGEQERVMSYLPLSHVAGMLLDIVLPIIVGAKSKGFASVYFSRPYDLKDGTFGQRLQFVRPTIFLGVPRVWEKIAEKLQAVGAKTTGWFCCFRKKAISAWAKRQGAASAANCQYGQGSGKKTTWYGLAEAMVFNPIKFALGLDECKFCVTGAAPITLETLNYFGSIGMTINEVYGMSESTALATWSLERRHVHQSCGFAVPGTQVKIFNTEGNTKKQIAPCKDIHNPTEQEQGEICFRGRNVMMGYLGNPYMGADHMQEMVEKTQESIDSEGWLHSGDKGCMDINGMFRITGRYKELIIGAGGENIAPVPIEDNIKKVAPGISNVIMVGDKKKYNTCLVTLKAEGATGELPGSDNLTGPAVDVSAAVTTVSAAMEDPAWQKYVENAIKETNNNTMVVPNNAAKIQKFKILPRDFSVQTGEFTPTLKLKRAVCCKIWEEKINEMY